MAGKNRANTLAAILGNMKDLEGAYKTAMDAEGSAMRENAAYLDSIQGRINLFNNALQTMWMNLLDSDLIKGVVDLGTGLVKAFDTVLGKLVAIGAAIGALKLENSLKQKGTSFLDLLFDVAPKKIKDSTIAKDFGNIFSTFRAVREQSIKDSLGEISATDLLRGLAKSDDSNNILADLSKAFGINSDNIFTKKFTKKQIAEVLDGFDDISDATKEAILGMDLFSVSQKKSAEGTDFLTAAFAKAKGGFKGFISGISQFATLHPIITGLTAAVAAFALAWHLVDVAIVDHGEYVEQLNEETDTLQSIQSELQSVQSELANASARMDELLSKDKMTFVEEDEYNRLVATTQELKRQEAILQAQEARARKKQVETAVNAAKTDTNLIKGRFNTSATMLEGMYYATLQQPEMFVPDIINENAYDSNLRLLEDAKADLDAAQEAFAKNAATATDEEYQILKKNLDDAQASVNKYNETLDKLNETWQVEYGEVGYVENATTEAEKAWNEYYRQHQDYLDQQAMINGTLTKGDVLDRTFGITGSDTARAFREEFEKGVDDGGDPTEVIEALFENADYSNAFAGLETQFGITMDHIKSYFTQTGEFAVDPSFDITKYTKYISAHSAAISEYQEAIQKLDKGSFTMDDFMSLIEKYPELAEGVDISSNAFYGLSRNLNRAIKSKTKGFIDDLKKLKKSMEDAGKSTDDIDKLIEAVENMPSDALDDFIDKYGTLADKMRDAKTANDQLVNSMSENPNENYENRGQAMEYMKEAMKRGEIGSESNLWNVAAKYGFTSDEKDLNKRADALADYIAIRDTWFKQDDSGNYTFEGTENFIESVEKAVDANDELAKILTWDYDDTTGEFNFNFANEDLPTIIDHLSKTKELIGLNEAEWHDLMIQIGQYFNVGWEKAKDVEDYITGIYEDTGTSAEKIKQMTDSVEIYIEKALGEDVDLSALTEAQMEAIEADENLRGLLETYLTLKEALADPLNIEKNIKEDGSIESLVGMNGLNDSVTKGEYGHTFINTDMFTDALLEAGYAEENISSLIGKIIEYQSVMKDIVVTSNNDPLGLNSQNASIASVMSSLNTLGVTYESIKDATGSQIAINITATDLITALQQKGWEASQIQSYLQTLTSTENGLGIQVDGKVNMSTEEIDAAIAKANEVPEQENTTYTVGGDGAAVLQGIIDAWANVPLIVETNYTIKETTIKETINKGERSGFNLFQPSTWFGSDVNGTAHAEGSWGAPKTETALVGELGPEMLVRNGRWTTVGNNGAEFTQVRRGDIIFNHKQTEDLLSKGYVTGRGKLHGGAFASGTAFSTGKSTFGRYEFDGNGGWKEYDVNNKLVDPADGLAAAADALADATDEFKEVFDWIAVRIEELDETLSLLESQIENAVSYNDKNTIIDDLIKTNQTKLENLEAGYEKYSEFAEELLAKVPEEYHDAVKNGTIEIEAFTGEDGEKTLEAINNYREWVQKAADYKQQANEILTTIRDLAIQKFENAYNYGDVRATVEDSQTEKLQNQIDLLEEMGEIASTVYYGINGGDAANSTGMFENSYKKIEYLTAARDAMQEELDAAVKAGQIEKGSNEWYDLVNQMYEVESQIHDARVEIEEFQNAINDIYWENFDQLISRIDYLKDETQSLIDLMSHDDLVVDPAKRTYENGTVEYWTADDVTWTEEGLATLGLYAQQMEIAEYRARQYSEAIDDLTKEYNAGHYSENEYYEKLNELKDAQYESIEAYYDAQDAIKDLNQTRIDSIKKGIEKEIEAYEELINAKKELLDAEKDAHDFQKTVLEQQKNISDIERKLAALAYDNSASARAKRAQLEAELAEARAELDETYYDRSIEEQQNALDKELENFQKEKDAEVEKMEEYLEDIKQVITDSLLVVQSNASSIYDTLTGKAEEYNLTLSDSITAPWQDGSLAVSGYQETFDTAMSSTMDQLDALKNKWQEVIDKMVEVGNTHVDAINKENESYATATKSESISQPTTSTEKEEAQVGDVIKVDSDAPIYGDSTLTTPIVQYFASDPYYTVVQQKGNAVLVRHKSQNTGYTGWFKDKDITTNVTKKYAKGTKSVPKDQLAIIDELGEELQLVPDGNGRLAYLTKGTSVIPADLTTNLMEWGALDPADMLDRNKPQIGVSPSVVNNTTEIHIDASVGELVHVEHMDGNNPAELTKVIDKAWDKRMKELNGYIRRYTNR